MNYKDRKIIIFGFIIVFILLGYLGWMYKHNASQAGLCQQAEDTGWAPVGPIEYAPRACDGKRLDRNSPLIEDGYTCYCHKPNTCWDGEKCIERPVDNNLDE